MLPSIYFRKEVALILRSLVGRGTKEGVLLLKYLVVLTLITGVMGVAIYVSVSSLNLGNAIGVPMVILGSILILDGLLITISRKRYTPRLTLETMTMKDLVAIGFCPGTRRVPWCEPFGRDRLLDAAPRDGRQDGLQTILPRPHPSFDRRDCGDTPRSHGTR